VQAILTKVLKRFVDKDEFKQVTNYFEKMIKNLHAYMKSRFSMAEENDDAMLTKKPLGGFSCASCEKHLKNVSGTAGDY